jgi:RimJ/RimL family protein N-acetyltransferase
MTRPLGAQGGAETERLLLLPWTEEYSGDFARVCADPEAMRFISGGRPLTDDDIRAIIDRTLAMWDQYGYGPWAAIDKQTGQWAGRIGLSLLADWPGPDRWEVGFELAPEYWGRGLATEGARSAIRFGWSHTPLARIISVTAAGHRASRRVMEKCGLTFQAEETFRTAQVAWYAIDRPASYSTASHLEGGAASGRPSRTGQNPP